MTSTPPEISLRKQQAPKALWATIGALAVAVVAMGGVLLHQHIGGESGPSQAAPAAALAPVRAPEDFRPPAAESAPAAAVAPPATGAPPAAVSAPTAGAPAAIAPPPPVAQSELPPPVSAPPPRPPVCKTCGRVESVRAVQKQQPTSGVGAVAGGVLGGVLGHQIGNGNGRTAATVLGAVGGGFAGNEVEKRTHTLTVYEVSVRMQDGSLRHVQTGSAPPVGKPVTLRNGVLSPADGQP